MTLMQSFELIITHNSTISYYLIIMKKKMVKLSEAKDKDDPA